MELPKADRLRQNAKNPLSAWIRFFEHAQDPHIMSQINHPPVQQATTKLRKISQDELERLRALARDRALMDQTSMRNEARSEGRAEGRVELLERLLARRFGAPLPDWVRPRLQAAGIAQLDAWAEGIFDTPTLEALLAP